VPADGEAVADAHFVLRQLALDGVGIGKFAVLLRSPHQKIARRQRHHLGALITILEA
jgi:hypothetical protein